MSRFYLTFLVFGLLALAGCPLVEQQSPGAIAVWQQDGGEGWEIRYSLWDDNSAKWYVPSGGQSELIAALPGDDNDPSVDSDGADTAIAVWSHEEGNSADIYYSVWKSGSWSTPAPVAIVDGYDSDPAVAMGASGALAVWVHKEGGTNTLYYSEYGGGAWSAPDKIDGGISGVSLPELSFSSTLGAYLLAWSGLSGQGARIFTCGYSGGIWSPQVEIPAQAEDAAFDSSVPASMRIGLASAMKKREAIVAWESESGKLYSSAWTPSGWSDAAAYASDSMPDAAFEAGGVPYSLFIKGGNLHWSRDMYFGSHVEAVPGTGEDYRPAITFIGDGTTGLGVFWTTKTAPGEIYYSRYDGSSWSPVEQVDSATVPGEDRNPDVSPLEKADQDWEPYFDFCGDGVLQWPNIWGQFEQCEAGIPCPNPADFCNANCLCIPDYGNNTFCGDGIVQRPNSAGVMEECEAGVPCVDPQDACDVNKCKCIPVEEPQYHNECSGEQCVSVPGPGADECIVDDDCLGPHFECEDEKCVEVQGPGIDECIVDDDCMVASSCGNGHIDAAEECDVGGGFVGGILFGAAPDTCAMGTSCGTDCKCHNGVVTPYCGDGYISGPMQGANEECDLGGLRGSPVLPDTCPYPEKCSFICRCEEEEIDDGMHYGCVEGACELLDGEGPNECIYDSQCWHYSCEDENCIKVMYPGSDQCYVDDDCLVKHTECIEEECVEVSGLGEDECIFDEDCIISHLECVDEECVEVQGDGEDECLFDWDCVEEAYCGDGEVQEELGEECESDNDCSGEEVCNNCRCIAPPDLDCDYICGQTSGASSYGHGLSSAQECSGLVSDQTSSQTCKTTCTYSWFYKVENVAGSDSCCCGAVKRFDCENCPCTEPCEPDCPGQEICASNAPSWWSPPD